MGGPRRAVILRHDTGDGSWHYDWLIDAAGGAADDERRVMAFRTRGRPDAAGVWGFEAERLADHRAAYLEFEGPVSGGGGMVQRVATGRVVEVSEGRGEVVVVIDWGEGPVGWAGRQREDWPESWWFEARGDGG